MTGTCLGLGIVMLTPAAPGVALAHATPAPAMAATPQEATAYAVVLAGRLNVREGPSLDAPVVATISRGARLCVVRHDGDWAEVRTPREQGDPDARTGGFVSRGFVSETRATPRQLEEMGCG